MLEMREELNTLKSENPNESGIGFVRPGTIGLTTIGFALIWLAQIFAKEILGKGMARKMLKVFDNKG